MTSLLHESIRSLRWSQWPEYKNHTWDGTPDPFYRVARALVQRKNVGIESGTSTGKTYIIARLAYWFLEVFPNSLVITTAPKQQQLKNVLWSEINATYPAFKKIQPLSELYSLRVLPLGSKIAKPHQQDIEEMSDDWQMIGIVSGVSAEEASATRMQGYHREHMLFVVDEAAGVSPAVFTAIKNTCTADNNLIVALGNPDSVTDALHQFCELPHVEHIRISAYDHPNVVLGRTVIPGAVTRKSIQERKDEYGEGSHFFESRIRGIAPAQSTDSLLMYDWIIRACRWRPEYDHNIADERHSGNVVTSENALGIDVANSESGDAAALAWGKANVLVLLEQFVCPNANAIADNVMLSARELQVAGVPDYNTEKLYHMQVDGWRVGVDAVGVGAGTVNQFNRLNASVVALQGGAIPEAVPHGEDQKPLYRFINLRAQMFFQFRLDLMREEIIFDFPDASLQRSFIRQAVAIKYKVGTNGIQIEKKTDLIKRLGGESPNLLDAAVYWNWMRKDRQSQTEERPFLIK